jgi:hypothetical protein
MEHCPAERDFCAHGDHFSALLPVSFVEIDNGAKNSSTALCSLLVSPHHVGTPLSHSDPVISCNSPHPAIGRGDTAEDAVERRGSDIIDNSHRLVAFSEDISIIFIPRRCDYPEDLRRLIFPNKKELSKNVARNMKEFASEGFDWRKVKEGKQRVIASVFLLFAWSHSRSWLLMFFSDHEMYITAEGERIHPLHLADIMSKRVIPLPAIRNLPKPKPQRPMHPKMKRARHHKPIDPTDTDPMVRPPTPFPFLMEGIVG